MTEQTDQQLAREIFSGKESAGDFTAFLEQHIQVGQPDLHAWSFVDHEYLRALAADDSPDIVIEKAAQMGISTIAIAKALHTASRGFWVSYFLPTKDFMKEFVQTRVDPMISASQHLCNLVTDRAVDFGNRRKGKNPADNTSAKQVGAGPIFFSGMQKLSDVKSRPLDFVILDEVSELPSKLVQWVGDRLLHSKLKMRLDLSQPDIPHMGIDARFEASDQKYWALHCPRCRTWNILEENFPDCVIRVRREWRLACIKCHAKLDKSAGQWVAKHPDRARSGYHLSQLYGPEMTAAFLAAEWAEAQKSSVAMQRFQISIIGNPYAGDRQPINDELLSERCGDWDISPTGRSLNLPQGKAIACVDVGDEIYLIIYRTGRDGVRRIVWAEMIHDMPDKWDLVYKRCLDHKVLLIAVDAKPEKTKAKELVRRYGRGAIVYTGGKSTAWKMEDPGNDPVAKVNADRTEIIDNVAEAFQSGEMLLPKASLQITALIKSHLKAFVKNFDAKSGRYEYQDQVENHFGMCLAHGLLVEPSAEGIPFEIFDEQTHVVGKVPPLIKYWVSLRLGPLNTLVALAMGLSADKTLFITDEWRSEGLQKSDQLFSRELRAWIYRLKVAPRWVFVDPEALNLMNQLFYDKVKNLAFGNDAMLEGVRWIATLVQAGRLKISANCPGLIKDLNRYTWDVRQQGKDDKPMPSGTEFPDALTFLVNGTREVWQSWIHE